jgi:uncharacterized protein YjbI with pentapeptide repeats
MMQVANTSLQNILFTNCKIVGVLFNNCNDFLFEVKFTNCCVDFSTFNDKKMLKTVFTNCSLKEVNFSETNLSSSIFDNCNLENAVFDSSNLTSVDFSTSYNFKIDPEFNVLKKAKFTTNGLLGLLEKYDIKIV